MRKPSALPTSTRRWASVPRAAAAPAQRAPWWPAFWGGLLGLVLALVLFAPAVWLADAVASATDTRVQLSSATGTVWSGSGRLRLSGGAQSRDAAALPGQVHWTLRPTWRGLAVSLRADCCTPQVLQADVQLGWGSATVRVQDRVSQWPAAVLAGLGTPWNTVLLEGQLALSTRGLSVEWAEGRIALRGLAQLDALEAASRLSTLKPLGSYRLTLTAGPASTDAAAPAQLALETLSGDLRLSGSGQWVGSRLRFTGQASAAPEREAALANLLNILGRRQGANSIITIG